MSIKKSIYKLKYYSQITTTDYCAITKCHKLRVLLEIHVVGAAHLSWPKPGTFGSAKWTRHRSKMPSALCSYLSLTSAGHVWRSRHWASSWTPFADWRQSWRLQEDQLGYLLLKKLRPGMIGKNLCLSVKEGWLGRKKKENNIYIQWRGYCIIFYVDKSISKDFRNTHGTILLSVSKLNILTLAPGGHMG